MKPPPFAYHRPESREAVDRLLADHGDEAKILAGGQSLLPILNMHLSAPARPIDLNGLDGEPGAPVRDAGTIRSSPLVRHSAAERGWHPLLGQAMAFVGHPAIRSRGTVVGSIAHADPAAELPAVMVAVGGEARVRGASGRRTIAAADLFAGPLQTTLEPGEWIEEVRLPVQGDRPSAVVEF